jgi:hypothetical protein
LSYLCLRPFVFVTVMHISHVIDEIQELWNHSKERISRREQENALCFSLSSNGDCLLFTLFKTSLIILCIVDRITLEEREKATERDPCYFSLRQRHRLYCKTVLA